MPSLSQTAALSCGNGIASRRFSAAARSPGQGFGCKACNAARASAARIGCNAGGGSSEAKGAVVTSTT